MRLKLESNEPSSGLLYNVSTPVQPHSSNHHNMDNLSHNNNNNNSNPYLQVTPVTSNKGYGTYATRPMAKICDALNRCGKSIEDATRKAEVYADNIRHHFKVSSGFTDAAMARIAQGTKVLTEGGYEKVFQRTFEALAGEKLLKAYVCYLSTSSGPVSGTLYISTKRVAFCSDYPLCDYTSTGQQQWMCYKAVVQLDKLREVKPSSNGMNPPEKYIQIVTTDGHEFWFMGFISYEKALKRLLEASQLPHNVSVA